MKRIIVFVVSILCYALGSYLEYCVLLKFFGPDHMFLCMGLSGIVSAVLVVLGACYLEDKL